MSERRTTTGGSRIVDRDGRAIHLSNLTDEERNRLLGGRREEGETERDRLARIANEIANDRADARLAGARFNAPEPHAYSVEVLHNPGTSHEHWVIVDRFEFEPGTREDAEAELEEMHEDGYSREHLRLVALVVVEP